MRFTLKDYQVAAGLDVTKALRRATRDLVEDDSNYWSVSLSAPTGAGKTVIATSVLETLFDGAGGFPEDPDATILWVTDDPALNSQTRRKMMQASSTLSPARLLTIDSGFDSETFDRHRVYFLNIQKLARSNPLARSNVDGRSFSLWQTIANTIRDRPGHFYVVIDEAHKGMRGEGDRETIVSRIINGQAGSNPPAPIVWGISATPQRFTQAIRRWEVERTSRAVMVPIDDVKASGLLKDLIVLDNPAANQTTGDTTLVRAAVARTLEFEADWKGYTDAQDEPAVFPILVVQLHNSPTESELSEIVDAVFGSWPGLIDDNVVNTFADHAALSVRSHVIRYLVPQEIQDDLDVRVVLCKDAISTGWDCPRAEVLISLRAARDYTYIAQLIGRMVRTPLARRVPSNQSLNSVNTYLPNFDKSQVQDIVQRFASGEGDEPPVDLIIDPVRVWRNPDVATDVFATLEAVPTYVVPGKAYRTQVARAFSMAALLVGDHVLEDSVNQVRLHLLGSLRTQRERLESDGTFQKTVMQVKSLRVERSYALLAADSVEDLPPANTYDMALDSNNIDDLFKVAKRKFPEGMAQAYWNVIIDEDDANWDPVGSKAVVAALALHRDVVDALESSAEQLVQSWLKKYQKSIAQLSDARKLNYESVRREARDSELSNIAVPDTFVLSNRDKRWPKHLLAGEDGTFPCELRGWESAVLDIELADDSLIGWYRNPTGGQASVRIPYEGDQRERPMYPDFVFFHDINGSIVPSIVDPHGFHLTDAAPKLRGLASYAAKHGDYFQRIEAVIRDTDDRFLSLDLKSSTTRDAVMNHGDGSVLELFQEIGGDYS